MDKLEFRLLEADEIECRVAQINKGGVMLLLYKDARVDQAILDETVGPMNWQRKHTRDNQNCIVSIWDESKKMWVEKEDTGKESNTEAEKGLASDSFKRACFNWGIGRELYSAKNLSIFISKDKLKHYSDEGGKFKCSDGFKVVNISYDEEKRIITSVTIAVTEWGREHNRVTFNIPAVSETKPTVRSTPETKSEPKPVPKTEPKPVSASSALIADDEVILFGNCRGKKYGEVKDTAIFGAFLKWVKASGTTYPDADKNAQMEKFKKMAEAV